MAGASGANRAAHAKNTATCASAGSPRAHAGSVALRGSEFSRQRLVDSERRTCRVLRAGRRPRLVEHERPSSLTEVVERAVEVMTYMPVHSDGYELRHYVRVARRRWPSIIVPTVLLA